MPCDPDWDEPTRCERCGSFCRRFTYQLIGAPKFAAWVCEMCEDEPDPEAEALDEADAREAAFERAMSPDYTRQGMFVYHNCWKCQDGAKPCADGNPNRCSYPHARND